MKHPDNGVSADVLVADDEASFREAFDQMLRNRGYRTTAAATPDEVVAAVRRRRFDLVTLDLEWQRAGQNGIDILRQIQQLDPLVPIVIVTGHATIDTAKEATRLGAFDYIEKIADREKTLLVVRNAIESGRLRRGVRVAADSRARDYEIVGPSSALAVVREAIRQFGPTDVPVLIEGETGCGKELVAHQLHLQSPRRDGELIKVGGGELSHELGQDTLFGHRHGAFTGTSRERGGFVQAADKSTLFLDDISDVPLSMQPLFLRFLETGDFMKLGADERYSADVRVIAATNQHLAALVQQGKFRADLYYRLKVATIRVPPLRERREDIPLLVLHFVKQQSLRLYGREIAFDAGCLDLFIDRDWPGNVRELRNAIIAVLLRNCHQDIVLPDDARSALQDEPYAEPEPLGTLRDMESGFRRQCVIRALNASDGSVTRAAENLGVDRSTLYRLISEHSLTEYVKQLTA